MIKIHKSVLKSENVPEKIQHPENVSPSISHAEKEVFCSGGADKNHHRIYNDNNVETAGAGKVSIRKFFEKLKRVKHIEIYTAIAVIGIMVFIYFSTFGSGAKASSLTTTEENFVHEMEQKLVQTLSQVKGAGKVDAMVTAVGSATLEIAYNIDEKTITQSNGTSSNTTITVVKTPVIINGKNGSQPLVLLEIKPKLKGVVIVASGASDPGVRLMLLRAVQALVSDSTVNIEILARK